MTSKYQNFAMNYVLTRSLFLGIGFSLIIGIAKQDSVISFTLGTILGLFFTLLINKIQKTKGDKCFGDFLNEMGFLGKIIRFLLIIYGIFLFLECLSFFQVFTSAFLLNNTPLFFISLPLLLLVIKISQGGISTLFRVSGCIFPISFGLTLFSQFFLFGYADFENLKPLFMTGTYNLIKTTLFYTSLSVTPTIMMLITKNENTKNHTSYLLGSITLIFKVLLIIAIIGPILASIYRFPEYMILKEIKLMDFIEKIENIVGLSWIFDYFIYISMTSVFIKELLPKKVKNILHIAICIIIYFIAFIIIGKDYLYIINIYYGIPYICFGILILTILPLFIYSLKKKNSSY